MTNSISLTEFLESDGVQDWHVVGDGGLAHFRTESFATAAQLLQGITELPGVNDHFPDVDLQRDGVTVRLITTTDDYYGISRRDVEVASQISEAARELCLTADPASVQSVLVIPGAPVSAKAMPFWRPFSGMSLARQPRRGPGRSARSGAFFWFEDINEPRPNGGGAIRRNLGSVRAGPGSRRHVWTQVRLVESGLITSPIFSITLVREACRFLTGWGRCMRQGRNSMAVASRCSSSR